MRDDEIFNTGSVEKKKSMGGFGTEQNTTWTHACEVADCDQFFAQRVSIFGTNVLY